MDLEPPVAVEVIMWSLMVRIVTLAGVSCCEIKSNRACKRVLHNSDSWMHGCRELLLAWCCPCGRGHQLQGQSGGELGALDRSSGQHMGLSYNWMKIMVWGSIVHTPSNHKAAGLNMSVVTNSGLV